MGRLRAGALIGVVLVLAGVREVRAGDALADCRARGTLRWGGDVQGGEPYVAQDAEDGHLVGFEVELADGIARHLGLRAEFVQNDWQNLVPALERGDFDVIINGLEVTPARRARIAFTRPYYRFTETLVVRAADTGVASLADLAGQRVGTLGGSLAHDLLRAARPAVEIVLYEGDEEPYLDLTQRRLAAVLLDDVIADRHGLTLPGLRSAASLEGGVYAVGVRSTDATLREAVDGAIATMAAAGELQAILEHWKLWNARQVGLAEARSEDVPVAGRRRLTRTHLGLFLRAAGVTVVVSIAAMALAVFGGMVLALARREGGRVVAGLVRVYVELFRGTPVLLQLYVLYFGLAPVVALSPFAAAVLGLGLNYAAYEAELYRAGLAAVPDGQSEAALALGFSRWGALRHIVLPQALRIALPGIANDFIALLKDSSLVSVITVIELTKQMTITAVDVHGWLVPGLLGAALYLAMSLPLSRLARWLERRLVPVPS